LKTIKLIKNKYIKPYFFRIYLESGSLTLGYNGSTGADTTVLYKDYLPDTWTNLTLLRQSTLITIFVNTNITQISISDNVILTKLSIGGFSDSEFPYRQFNGLMRDIILDGLQLLSLGGDFLSSNVVIQDNSVHSAPILDPFNQTVTINSSQISFPVTMTSFSNFTLSFEFKSPDNTILFLTFRMKQYFFSLRKDNNQLILELNVHGTAEHLVVELTSVTEWIVVTVTVTDQLTLLSAGHRNVEVKSLTPIANKKLDRRPIIFGWNESSRLGFRGCLRNVVAGVEVVELYDVVTALPGTLVGCWYPSPHCDTLACPFSCTQTWDQTECVTGNLSVLFVVCCLLFVVCCLLFVVCCLLFVVCCLLYVLKHRLEIL